MKHTTAISIGLLVGLFLPAAPRAQADNYTLEDISFMVGHWKGEGELAPEEQWLEPQVGNMAGFMRWNVQAGMTVLELLTFREEEDGITFRFKHFGLEVDAWEKDEANTYRVNLVENNCLYMDQVSENADVPDSMSYCRIDENTLEFVGKSEDETWAAAGFRILFNRLN